MSSIVSIGDVYEAVLRAEREKEKSYDEAVKEFLEVFDELVTTRKKEVFDLAVANMDINGEFLKKGYDEGVEAYLKAREKYKIEPKKLFANTCGGQEEPRVTTSGINDLKKRLISNTMASIAIMVGRAVLNATAFIGGNYPVRALGGGNKAALEEKKYHDKALEAYQAAYAKYVCNRTHLLDWIGTNAQLKAEAKQNFTNTDFAFKLYNQVHPDEQNDTPQRAQVLRCLTTKRAAEKWCTHVRGCRGSRSELCSLPVPLNFFTPYSVTLWKPNSKRNTTAPGATGKVSPRSKN